METPRAIQAQSGGSVQIYDPIHPEASALLVIGPERSPFGRVFCGDANRKPRDIGSLN